jgi:hypothetical protein
MKVKSFLKIVTFQSLKPAPHLFAQLSKVLKLSKVQEVSVSRQSWAETVAKADI